jgi:2-polyprenyl-3-methyl-5-hydroxy-6-metoxy-1,4-benzoquinol methylase
MPGQVTTQSGRSAHDNGVDSAAAARHVTALTDPSSLLDVGCGRGPLVSALAERGVEAYGIDISEAPIDAAPAEVRNRLSVGPAEKLTGTWDLITCVEVLQHLRRPTRSRRSTPCAPLPTGWCSRRIRQTSPRRST